jgi:hypothetical protein
MSISRMSRGGDRRPVYDAAWAALRSQCGFARNNDAGGEINGSASGARDTSGCDRGAVHPAKLATTRNPRQNILTNAFLTVPPA